MRGFARIVTIGLALGAAAWSAEAHAELVPKSDDITFEIKSVDGDVSKQAVEEAVKKRTKTLESCYAKAIEEQEKRYERVIKTVFANSDGEVFAVEGRPDDQKGFSLRTCVHRKMGSWTFPETANGGISKVTLKIEFGKAYLKAYRETDEYKEKRRKMASKSKKRTIVGSLGAASEEGLGLSGHFGDTSKPEGYKKVYGAAQEEPPEGPHFSRGELSAAESVDGELLAANINHRRHAIDKCYEQALLRDDSVEGAMKVTVEMGADGKPASVETDSELPKPLASCVETALAPKRLKHLEGSKGDSASGELKFRRSSD